MIFNNKNNEINGYINLIRTFIYNSSIKINNSFQISFKIAAILYISFIFFSNHSADSIHKINNVHTFNKKMNYKNLIELDINNKKIEYLYENNIDYSSYNTKIKSIAIYYPNINSYSWKKASDVKQNNNDNNSIIYYNKINEYKIKKKEISSFVKTSFWNNYFEYKFILKQIKLAKTHGIYGFGIYIYWFSGNIFFDKYINQFLENKNIDFHYLFILNNRNIENQFHINILKIKYNKKYPGKLITKFKAYFLDERYIKIDYKPVICVDANLKRIDKLNSVILLWRKIGIKFGIGQLFIVCSLRNKKHVEFKNLANVFDAGYELLPNYLFKENLLMNFKDNSTFFSGLIYRDINFSEFKQFPVFRGCTLENKIKIKNHTIFEDYYPEYFYIMNKMIINWTIFYHNESNYLIFINAWNNYMNGAYLEPNQQFGFCSINSISKALFNLSYSNNVYNLTKLLNNTSIAVQVHVFYSDLIKEVIDNVNNIPVKFDLYITTTSIKNKLYIEEYLKKYSKADKYNIKIVKNKGRDIYPMLIQMRNIWHNYKYICHIHTKKSVHDPIYGINWRHYLFKNLLGDEQIISNILTYFENDEKLGFIFPETFYEAKVHALKMNENLENSINYLLNKILGPYKIGNILDFPAGDMFWAKIKSIYQMFTIDFSEDICQEGKPLTMLYALERIWLYIVKLNGYRYKKTCGYY